MMKDPFAYKKNNPNLLYQYKFEKKHLIAISKFQRRIKELLRRKALMKAINMNSVITHKNNCFRLKKNLQNFENTVITKKNNYKYFQVYKTVKKFRNNTV